eukprot:TRINITY_DN9214_c0_g1_i1.p1 TRINITY_DN9214_c0_g1~~TRINITY_DN9214_c0_g1_i1.p1  ORF type:complete len:493 (-),score=76.02 TRINITY_DN9214_c0_g1_i1:26-1504(-)
MDVINCIKRPRSDGETFVVYTTKFVAVLISFIVGATQFRGLGGSVLIYFFTCGLIEGSIYGILWILLRTGVNLKTMYKIGFRQGLDHLGITNSSFGSRIQWIFFLMIFFLVIFFPVYTLSIVRPNESSSIIGISFLIFFSFPAIVLGYIYQINWYRERNSLCQFVLMQILLWLFVLVIVSIFIGILHTSKNDSCTEKVPEIPEISEFEGKFWEKGSEYPICRMQWENLNIVDYGLMANLAYLTKQGADCARQVDASLKTWFPQDTWKVVGGQKKGDLLGFLHLYEPVKNLSIITVRGTVPTRATDVLQDFDLFNEISILQAMSYLFPIFKYWTDTMIQNFVYLSSLLERFLSTREYGYYYPVIDYVNMLKTNHSDQYSGPIIFVGHSLGGAIAKIVGVKFNCTSIAFGSPGLFWSSKKFELDTSVINSKVVNIALTNDLVPMVDKQGGLVQHVTCPSSSPLACHVMKTGLCLLLHTCDPSLGRNSGNVSVCN